MTELLRLYPLEDRAARHDPSCEYSRRFWLPAVGPTGLVLVQWMADQGAALELELPEASRALGLGGRHGSQSPLVRTLDRMTRFRLTRRQGPLDWSVAVAFPDLPPALHRHLPSHVDARLAS